MSGNPAEDVWQEPAKQHSDMLFVAGRPLPEFFR